MLDCLDPIEISYTLPLKFASLNQFLSWLHTVKLLPNNILFLLCLAPRFQSSKMSVIAELPNSPLENDMEVETSASVPARSQSTLPGEFGLV